ncbi:hypothetical protein [Vibrio sp. D431a]|uniref:hypothetical protein n=1 Tax=Vibrio sp. D431a TaxID=2837388 RepID=UPI0025551FBA|nr:hypothetical protein [Vibrio sp. D431a]MDK9790038.1 hypothetical protein [Vibrio sp. D431a]
MAAIEKICEFSGEYPAWLMYGYKRNHIQVIPKYRKMFRGAQATLHFFKGEPCLVRFKGGEIDRITSYHSNDLSIYGDAFANEKEYLRFLRKEKRQYLRERCWFALEVFDEQLKGEVEGVYTETTLSPKCVIRRIKRLVADNKLKVVRHDCSIVQWQNERDASE